jgi:hypothetical protein
MDFEWAEDKRLSNIAKHDIDFLRARAVFDGRPVLETQSSCEAEERFITVGPIDERYVTAVWTPRQGNIRFISVRYARHKEIRAYLGGRES